MAVYTEVSDEDLQDFLAFYDLGDVVSFKGIAEGVENSNYLLQTERGSFILTLYEKRTKPSDLPFFLGLMEHLAGNGLVCPTPLHGKDGDSLRRLCGKPAAMVSFLSGVSVRRPTPEHCAGLGETMAKMHLKAEGFSGCRANDLSVSGWRPLFEATRSRADEIKPGLAQVIDQALETLEKAWPQNLPKGLIHADLFPDNVFFRMDKASQTEKVSGVIDFYFACTDFFAYDVAICLNAWCFESDGSFNATKARSLLHAYRKVRPLSPQEIEALPLLAGGAAMRFLLTRLYDWLNTPEGAFVKRKDPLEYYRKLCFHQGLSGPGAYGID